MSDQPPMPTTGMQRERGYANALTDVRDLIDALEGEALISTDAAIEVRSALADLAEQATAP